VSGALAGDDSTRGAPAATQAQDQTVPRDNSPRDRGDCPDKDGRGGSGSDASVEL
jgi:hypothetical protein